MTAVATALLGPLTTDADLPESALFGSTRQAARWLAYVGLGGQFAAVPHTAGWSHWNGFEWVPARREDVHRAVRRVLGTVYDRHMASDPTPEQEMQLMRLMDLNWRLGPLMWALRPVLTVDPERLL